MTMNDLEWLRWLNALLGLAAFLLVARDMRLNWREWEPKMHALSASYILMIVTGTYGSVEASWQHAPTGFRTVFVTIAFMWAVMAFTVIPWINNNEKKKVQR